MITKTARTNSHEALRQQLHMHFCNIKPSLIGTFLIIALFGCVTSSVVKDVKQEAVNQLRVGTTSKKEVYRTFGEPTYEYSILSRGFHAKCFGYEATWQRAIYVTQTGNLQAEFDKKGKLVDYFYLSSEDIASLQDKRNVFSFTMALMKDVIGAKKSDVPEIIGCKKHFTKTVNKEGVAVRWIYCYTDYVSAPYRTEREISKSIGSRIIEIGTAYKPDLRCRYLLVDFDPSNTVVSLRGESSFPSDMQ